MRFLITFLLTLTLTACAVDVGAASCGDPKWVRMAETCCPQRLANVVTIGLKRGVPVLGHVH